MGDAAWELAGVIVSDETRATAVASAMTRGDRVTLGTLPLSAHADDIQRGWRGRGHEEDPRTLEADVNGILERLGEALREALARGEWDWADRPPASFASWLSQRVLLLRQQEP